MIDLHSHILPGVDDGPAGVDGAVELARAAVAAGTTTIVATPHIAHGLGPEPLTVRSHVEALQRVLAARGIALDVRSGGEIAMSRVVDLSAEELRALRLGGGPYLLVEAPFSPAVGDFAPILFALQERGHGVLLAHPERCPAIQRDPRRLAEMAAAGVLVQITAASLTGDFGGAVREFALKLLGDGLVHVVASDAHDAHRRPPGLVACFAAAERDLPGSLTQRDWLTRAMPAAILSGDDLPARPQMPAQPRRRWLRRAS